MRQPLQRDPGDEPFSQRLCQQAGASKRTIERIFREGNAIVVGQVATTVATDPFAAIARRGRKNHHAALEAGYSTPSAFIAMFRKALGTTPRQYFEKSADATSGGPITLRVAEVDHDRSRAEPVCLVADVKDSDREPDAADRFGDDIQIRPRSVRKTGNR